MNEFGMMEMVEEDDGGKQTKSKNSGDKENFYSSHNSSNASPPAISCVDKKSGSEIHSPLWYLHRLPIPPSTNIYFLFIQSRGKEVTTCRCRYYLLLRELRVLRIGC